TDGATAAEHIIKVCIAGIDDDRTGHLAGVEMDSLAAEPFRQEAVLVLVCGVAGRFPLREVALLRPRIPKRLGPRGGEGGRQSQGACKGERAAQAAPKDG